MKHGLNTDQAELGTNTGSPGRTVARFRQGTIDKRADLGLSGWEMGKTWNFYRFRIGFSHLETGLTRLFPQVSTQVVDFPRICTVRLFWGSPEMLATDETQIIHRWGQEVEREGTGRRVNHGWTTMGTDLTEK